MFSRFLIQIELTKSPPTITLTHVFLLKELKYEINKFQLHV
jgi:hypothetical protein